MDKGQYKEMLFITHYKCISRHLHLLTTNSRPDREILEYSVKKVHMGEYFVELLLQQVIRGAINVTASGQTVVTNGRTRKAICRGCYAPRNNIYVQKMVSFLSSSIKISLLL